MKTFLIWLAALASTIAIGAATSQVNTYTDGNVLTGAQLTSEFGNIYSTLNSIDEGNLGTSVDFPGSSLDAAVAGDGLGKDGSENLEVKVDGTTIQITGDELEVVTAGVLTAGSVNSTTIADGTVASIDIADGTIANVDIGALAVGRDKLAVRTTAATVTGKNVGLSGDTGAAALVYGTGTSADLPNNEITITSAGGPLKFEITGGTSTTDSYVECEDAGSDICTLELWRGGTKVYAYSVGSQAGGKLRLPPGSFSFIDTPAAGTYTYKIRVENPSADAFRILNTRLMGYEL